MTLKSCVSVYARTVLLPRNKGTSASLEGFAALREEMLALRKELNEKLEEALEVQNGAGKSAGGSRSRHPQQDD